MAFPKYHAWTAPVPDVPEPGEGLASLIPPSIPPTYLDPNYPAEDQYMWVKPGVLIFTLGQIEPPDFEKAYLLDHYANNLIDEHGDLLVSFAFIGTRLRYLTTNGGADTLWSGGSQLFTITDRGY